MSRSNLIKRTVRKTINTALEHDFYVDDIFDGEEWMEPETGSTMVQYVEFATGTDEAVIRFKDPADEKFIVCFAFDNLPSEMIYDHSDTDVAGRICTDVAEHFMAKGQ